MEEQEEGIFPEINKHREMTNDEGKIAEVKLVENKTENRPSDNDVDSVGVVKKERSWEDVLNFLIAMEKQWDKRFDEWDKMMDKRFDEREEMMDKHFDNLNKIMDEGFNKLKNAIDKPDEKREEDRCKLKVESKQVSGNNCLLYTSRCV